MAAQAELDAKTRTPAAALAQLAKSLMDALMLGVQRTAELNLATTRSLLARSGSPWHGGPAVDNWRFSWRAFEIVSTTADDVLRLCDAHSRSSIDELWNAIEARQEALRLDTTCARELRTAFDGMRAASGAYFEAATNTHRRLLAIAEGGKS